MGDRRNVLIYSMGLAVAMLIFFWIPDGIDILFGYHRWYFTIAALAIYLGLIAALLALVRKLNLAPHVYARLRRRGFDVCPCCGYWLRGLDSADVANCPECGNPRSTMPGA